MTATLARLLTTRMVANRRFVSASNSAIRTSEGCFLSSTSPRSEGDNEKKAISEAEAKPDNNKRTAAHTRAATAEAEGAVTDTFPNQSAT